MDESENNTQGFSMGFDMTLRTRKPRICQWFYSTEGEGGAIGEQSLYIRLGVCNLTCKFCDTKFSWTENNKDPYYDDTSLLNAVKFAIAGRDIKRITITGGEPLLHMEHFVDIIDKLKNECGCDITHLGIESNGSVLFSKENAITLLKVFNKLRKKFGLKIRLTISPKIDASTSWTHTSFIQEDVDNLYDRVYENTETILNIYGTNYKFVYDCDNDVIDFEHTLKMINKLIYVHEVPRRNILLMPLTPDDPTGKGENEWKRSKYKTARKAMDLGIRFSPRLHVDLEMD